jgi:thiosulfate/3-mercaptopyruvate sulfurtransferase
MSAYTTLIDAATLATRRDVVIFDCRFDLANTSWGESEFAAAHIPGAQYLHLDRDLSRPVTASSGRHPLPDPDSFARRLGAAGVDTQCQVVAYDQGTAAYAARFWWLARWIGLTKIAVLDGGMASWRAAGLPLETQVRAPQARALEARIDERAAIAVAELEQAVRRPVTLLLDARGAERFAGRNETLDSVAGHVPGARNHPFLGNLGADGKFLPAAELRRRFDVLRGSLPPAAIVSMCGSGVTACQTLLALEHAGLPGARLYAGSWSEWIRDPARPVATGAT